MADLSKIKLNGVEYDIKDAVAREQLEDVTSYIIWEPGIDSNDQEVIGAVKTRDFTDSNENVHTQEASGIGSLAANSGTIASGNYSTAFGYGAEASGNRAFAAGYSTTASGVSSFACGERTTASATGSFAEGLGTTASAWGAHAEGRETTASQLSSHSEGLLTISSGQGSHAEGYQSIASGNYSHATGLGTLANCSSQVAAGKYNVADPNASDDRTQLGVYVEIIGNGTSTTRSNARTLDWSGNEWLAGKLTVSTGPSANMDVTTKQYVDGAITTAIGNVNSFNVNIVSGDLPTTNIDTHTIYFKSNSTTGNNVYDEYMYINNNWELIGSTQIDLTPYALSANLATVATSGDYDDLTDAPIAETDSNVEDMLNSFNLDYTSNTISLSYANGVSF